MATLVEDASNIIDLAWSPAGDCLFVSYDGILEAFRPAGESLGRLPGKSRDAKQSYWGICLTQDGRRVAAFDPQRCSVHVWDRSWTPIWEETLSFPIESLAMSSDGRRLAIGGDGRIELVDMSGGDRAGFGLDGMATSLTFSPDGTQLAAAVCTGLDNQSAEYMSRVFVWDAETGVSMGQSDPFIGSRVEAVYSGDGESILTGNWTDTIHVWKAETLELRQQITDGTRVGRFIAVASDRPVVVSAKGAIGAWDYTNGNSLTPSDAGHAAFVNSVVFVDGGRQIATASLDGVRIWDANTGEQLATLAGSQQGGWGLAVSPDGELLASGVRGSDLALWDRKSNTLLRRLSGHRPGESLASVTAIDFSPDGELIASAGMNDESLIVWEVATGTVLRQLEVGGIVSQVRFSPDCRHLVYGLCDKEQLHVVDIAAWQHVKSIEQVFNLPWCSFDVAPQGDMLAMFQFEGPAGSLEPDIKLQMRGLPDGKVRWERRVKNHQGLRFSPNGKLLVATTHNHGIEVYTVDDGSELARWKGHHAMIYCLAFSPDGSRLASGSEDTTALVWDLRNALKATGR
jgi:WD40 repeat protein